MVREILRAPGLWLCNLGWHQPVKRGRMSGMTRTIGNTTLSYLDCQRCGRRYPGSVLIKEYRNFP